MRLLIFALLFVGQAHASTVVKKSKLANFCEKYLAGIDPSDAMEEAGKLTNEELVNAFRDLGCKMYWIEVKFRTSKLSREDWISWDFDRVRMRMYRWELNRRGQLDLLNEAIQDYGRFIN